MFLQSYGINKSKNTSMSKERKLLSGYYMTTIFTGSFFFMSGIYVIRA